jgi:23S rRNA (pseudouridine1915-N3)-methyltransferase
MKIKVVVVSKTEKGYIKNGMDEFVKRLSRFADFEIIEVKETPANNPDTDYILYTEGERLIEKVPFDYYKVVLDVEGKMYDSPDFAGLIERIRDFEGGKICFIIGGPLGVSEQVRDIADLRLSLSPMTFTHQFIRVMLVEQVYRAFAILNGVKYHK